MDHLTTFTEKQLHDQNYHAIDKAQIPSFGYIVIVLFLSLGILLSLTVIMRGEYSNVCGVYPIDSYETVGEQLSEQIPPGSLIYWAGGESAAPLLYIPEVEIFSPQINAHYSFITGGDPDTILKNNQWNEILALKWVQEAEYILVERGNFPNFLREALMTDKYIEIDQTMKKFYCRDGTQIRVFKRLK